MKAGSVMWRGSRTVMPPAPTLTTSGSTAEPAPSPWTRALPLPESAPKGAAGDARPFSLARRRAKPSVERGESNGVRRTRLPADRLTEAGGRGAEHRALIDAERGKPFRLPTQPAGQCNVLLAAVLRAPVRPGPRG